MAFTDALTKRLALIITGESSGAVRALRETAAEVDKTQAKVAKISSVNVAPQTTALSKWVDDLRAKGGVAGKTLDQLGISGANAGAALKAGLVTGGAAAGAALAVFSAKAVSAASDYSEAVNKSKVIFGQAGDAVLDFAENSAAGFLLSKDQAVAATAQFGNLLQTIDQAPTKTAAMSVQLTKLAGDLASFNNIDTGAAIQKLMSGLSGESEPLRQVGVFLTEAKVKAEAYASGIAKAGEELSEAQKIQARFNVIMRETRAAQGDAERTANSQANVQRRLGVEFRNLTITLGQQLAPAALIATRGLLELVGMLGEAVGWVVTFQKSVGGLIAELVTLGKADANPKSIEVTSKAVDVLVAKLKEGGKYASDFVARLDTDTSFAQSIDAQAAKFPNLARAIADTRLALGGYNTEADKAAENTKKAADAAQEAAQAFIDLPKAILSLSAAQRDYQQSLRDLANVGAELRLAEIDRIEQGRQLEAQQLRNVDAAEEVTRARKELTAASNAEREAESAYGASLLELAAAEDRVTAARAELTRVSQGAGAASREYAAATEQVERSALSVAQAHLSEASAIAAAADAERALANAKRYAVQQYQLELAAARVSAQQAQASYQAQVVQLAALALASGQAAAAQQLLADSLLDSSAASQAAAQAALLVAQASLTAAQNAISLANAQQQIIDAQRAYEEATRGAASAQAELEAAIADLEQVMRGYGEASDEAADALDRLRGAELDARDSALDVAEARDRVAAAEANLAKAKASGVAADITRADRELQRAEIAVQRAERRLQEAREAAGNAQQTYTQTVSGAPAGSAPAAAAQTKVDAAQAKVDAANRATEQSYRSLQGAVQNLGLLQVQQAIQAQAAQLDLERQIAQTTLAIQAQGVSVRQAALSLEQLGDDPGRPYREIATAGRGAESANLAVKQSAYGVRDAVDEQNKKLEIQKGWLSGFSTDSTTYKAAYDKLRDAAGDYAGKQEAANKALQGLEQARSSTADARAAVQTSLGNIKAVARDVAIQTEKIKLQMQLSAAPADLYARRLDAAKSSAFNLAEKQAAVWDLQAKSRGEFVNGVTPINNYKLAIENLKNQAYPLASYLGAVYNQLRNISSVPAPVIPTVTVPAPTQQPTQQQRVNSGGGGGGGGGGSFATGGRVPGPGIPITVGERGPERFVPDTYGSIIPTEALGGVTIAQGAVQVMVQGDADGGTVALIRSELDEALRELRRQLASR